MAKRPATGSGPRRGVGVAGRAAALVAPLALLAWLVDASAVEPSDAPPPPTDDIPATALEIVPDPESITSLPGYVADRIPAPVLGDKAYVIEAGPADAPTLVLVHGVSRTGAHDWYEILPELAKHYRVLTFDLPGFHRSSGGNKLYSPVAYADFVLAVAEQRRPGPFFLIGHSMGGAISLEIAARGGDRVKRLLLVDVAGVLHAKAFYYEAIERTNAKLGGLARLFEGLRDGARDAGQVVPDAYAKLGEATMLKTEWLRGFLMQNDPSRVAAAALMAHDFGPAIGQIEAPTLLVWGELDAIAPIRTARAISSRLGNAPLVVLEGIDHVPMRESPERFSEIAVQWFDGTWPTTPGPEPAAEKGTEMDGECRSRRHVSFEGHYRRITINGCRDVVLRNVHASQVYMRSSVVRIESSVIEGREPALTLVGSELTMSGGHVRGEIAIDATDSELDLAGTTVEGSDTAIHARKGPTLLLCSVCRIESSHRQIDLHDTFNLLPGDKL